MTPQTMDAEMIRAMAGDWLLALIVVIAVVGAVVFSVNYATKHCSGGSDNDE